MSIDRMRESYSAADLETAEDYRIILANGDSIYVSATRIQMEDKSPHPDLVTSPTIRTHVSIFRGNQLIGEFVQVLGWYKSETPVVSTKQTSRVSGGVEDARGGPTA